MRLLVRPSRLSGEVAVPGSKSHTIRGIAAALAGKGTSTLLAPLESADTLSVLAAAERFGAVVERSSGQWRITGNGGRFSDPGSTVDLGNSGTGLRMLSCLAALQNFPVRFDGDSSLRTRKMGGLLASLQELGAQCESSGGCCPLTLRGPIRGGRAGVDGTLSQFLTALLFALPLASGDSVLDLAVLQERPYIGITLSWLETMGLQVRSSGDWLHWEIPGGQRSRCFTRTIPADFSTAAFPLVAASVAGDGVTIRNLDFSDAQGDKAVFGFLEQMGAELLRSDELAVGPARPLRGGEFDLNATPDALPILAVAGALADGETRLWNVPQARFKETDRIAVMAQELSKMGADIRELPDGLMVRGGRLHGATLASHGDHRIAMALAVAALAAEGESMILDCGAAAVTWPGFIPSFQALGADFIQAED